MNFFDAFHFLRPEWLLLLIPAWALVYWLLAGQNDLNKWQNIIDPKLLDHLLLTPDSKHSKIAAPWHLGVVLTLLIIAVSGPSWKLKANPFADDLTEVVLVVKVTESMLTTDITPNRLARVNIKIKDLLTLRKDTASALIAYSGTANLVLPSTKDHSIINTFAGALDPSIMPLKGDTVQEALLLAAKELKSKNGTIIILTDSVSPSGVKAALKEGLSSSQKVIFWEFSSKELSNSRNFKSAASLLDGKYVQYTPDESDVRSIDGMIDKNFQSAQKSDATKYEDGGYTLIPLIFLLLLLWARQGFVAELWRVS